MDGVFVGFSQCFMGFYVAISRCVFARFIFLAYREYMALRQSGVIERMQLWLYINIRNSLANLITPRSTQYIRPETRLRTPQFIAALAAQRKLSRKLENLFRHKITINIPPLRALFGGR
jgi:hypothetical protein